MRGVARTVGALLLNLLAAADGTANAATGPALSLKDLAGLADVVVRGRVEAAEARWEGGRIVTENRVVVAQAIRGAVKPGEPLRVFTEGGEVGELGQWTPGAARLSVGDDVVLFLEAKGVGFVVVGMALGRFSVEVEVEVEVETGPAGARREVAVRPADPDAAPGPGVRVPLDELVRTVRVTARRSR